MNAALALETQAAFRGLLDANARPGTVVDLKPTAARVAGILGEPQDGAALLLLAVTLFDAGTPFHVAGPGASGVRDTLRRHTYAPHVDLPSARFVCCTKASAAELATSGAHPGTLERPDVGATVIVTVQDLAGPLPSGHADATHTLSGPGVDGSHAVQIEASGDVLSGRAAHAGRYPQGVDMVLTTASGVLMALPRTTTAETLQPLKPENGGA